MPTPSIGIGRIKLPYQVNSLDHELHMFVSNPTLGGGVWSIDINPAFGGTAAWGDAVQGLADHISEMLGTGATPGTALLQEWSSTGWLLRDSATPTFPNVTGTAVNASQFTLSLRALDNSRPKIVVMEGNQTPPFHYLSPTGGNAPADALVDGFLGSSLTPARPWFFMTTMHGVFLAVSSFVSVTSTYSRVLRKARGLA